MLTNDEYRAIFEASPDGCVVVAADGTIRGVNPKIEALFGWRADELVGQNIDMLIPDSLRHEHQGHRERFAKNPHNRPMGVGLDLEGGRRDGSRVPVEVSLSPWQAEDGSLQVICMVRDVTAYRRLQNFSEGALRASEEERSRIARELHDDTAQRLATLILRVRRLAEEPDKRGRLRLLQDVRAEIVDAANSVKRMSRGLRPPEIEEVGLALAIQAHVRSLHEVAGFGVETALDPVDPYLDVTAKLALYRIVQEALSNARRHSNTEFAWVTLGVDDHSVVAEVRDEGDGFALATANDGTRGLGLVGMQERAAMIGGRLTIDAAPGEGTRVRVTVPIGQRENTDG